MSDKPIGTRIDEWMVRRNRDVNREEASEVDDGIPTNREACREYRDSQETHRCHTTHCGAPKRIRENESQRDARDDHTPNQRKGPLIFYARLTGLGAPLERKAQLRQYEDQ